MFIVLLRVLFSVTYSFFKERFFCRWSVCPWVR
jgi:hypothetical protein